MDDFLSSGKSLLRIGTVADPSLCHSSTFHSAKRFLLLAHSLKSFLQILLIELHSSLLELHALLDDPSWGY